MGRVIVGRVIVGRVNGNHITTEPNIAQSVHMYPAWCSKSKVNY